MDASLTKLGCSLSDFNSQTPGRSSGGFTSPFDGCTSLSGFVDLSRSLLLVPPCDMANMSSKDSIIVDRLMK